MIKDIIAANEGAVPNSREMAVLKENFPSCFHTDGTFDIERFKEFLSDKVSVTGEGYELKFLGKNYARLLASVDTTTVVMPDEEHNAKPENAASQNIYISGDNLDGLKHLLLLRRLNIRRGARIFRKLRTKITLHSFRVHLRLFQNRTGITAEFIF